MNKLWVQLVLAFGVVALIAVGSVAVIINQTTASSFRSYIGQQNIANNSELISGLERHYASTGSWEGAQALLPGQHGRGSGQGNVDAAGEGPRYLLADAGLIVVAANDQEQVGRALTVDERSGALKLTVAGTTVGYLLRDMPSAQALDRAQEDFLDDVSRALALTAVGAIALAMILGLGLAWTLIRPLHGLHKSAAELAAGHLGMQMPVTGTTEFREVATAFNRMSAALADSEAVRQRMTSDIAHELRSPVSVMRAQLEAMMDGVFPLTPEQLAVVYDQTLHLGRLVEDLRTLTRAEAGRLPLELGRVEPGPLAQRVLSDFAALAHDQGITLTATIAPDLPTVHADGGRLRQVLANLLANALTHTPAGGEVQMTVTRQASAVRLSMADTGPGLTREQSRQVFERFYRTDDARRRDQMGSGLGLAIAHELVKLHHGRIWVESAPGQGSSFHLEIPLDAPDSAAPPPAQPLAAN